MNPAYKDELKKQFERLRDENNNKLLIIDTDQVTYNRTDGIFSCAYLGDGGLVPFFLLLECKLDVDFNNIEDRSAVLTQVIAYLAQAHISVNNKTQKRFNLGIDKVPAVVVVGSKKNCFAISSKSIESYYTSNFDFNNISRASTFKDSD